MVSAVVKIERGQFFFIDDRDIEINSNVVIFFVVIVYLHKYLVVNINNINIICFPYTRQGRKQNKYILFYIKCIMNLFFKMYIFIIIIVLY